MADMYAVNGETLTGIADAIRSKTGGDEMMTVAAMASAIEGIYGSVVAKKAATEGEVIYNKYLEGASETPFSGWSISKYFLIDSDMILVSQNTNKYCAFYDGNKKYIGSGRNGVLYAPPSGAKYFRYSQTTDLVLGFTLRNIYGDIIMEG